MWGDTSDSELLAGPLQVLRNPKYRGSKRCTSLAWVHGVWLDERMVRKIVALLPKELPSLQQLSLSFFREPIDGSQFPNCPVLERVEIRSPRQPYPAFWGTNFAHVTTLSFGNSSPDAWEDCDIAILSLFTVLRDLTLFTVGQGAPERAESQQIVQFQYLQILRLCGDIPPKVLTRLVAPALEELHIKANAIHRTSIGSLWYHFVPLCQHLYAHLPEAVSVREAYWAAAFTVLVEKCTRLKTLHISKWMEEECQKFIGHCDIVLY